MLGSEITPGNNNNEALYVDTMYDSVDDLECPFVVRQNAFSIDLSKPTRGRPESNRG